MQVEHRILVQAPPQTLFRIYADVSRWHTWDPDTREARLDGSLQPGARGSLTPTQGRTVPMEVTAVQADRLFTVECRIPLLRMVFEHVLEPQAGGTAVTHRVRFHGLLAIVIGPMMIRRLNAGLPVTLARLRDLAQAQARAPSR